MLDEDLDFVCDTPFHSYGRISDGAIYQSHLGPQDVVYCSSTYSAMKVYLVEHPYPQGPSDCPPCL